MYGRGGWKYIAPRFLVDVSGGLMMLTGRLYPGVGGEGGYVGRVRCRIRARGIRTAEGSWRSRWIPTYLCCTASARDVRVSVTHCLARPGTAFRNGSWRCGLAPHVYVLVWSSLDGM